MRFLTLLLLVFVTSRAHADASVEALNEICDREISEMAECCLHGRCAITGTGSPLAEGPQAMRDFRRNCFAFRGETPPQCPNGRHIRGAVTWSDFEDDQDHLKYNCLPSDKVRYLTLSQAPDDSTKLTENDSALALLQKSQALCLFHLDLELKSTSLFHSCSEDRLETLTALNSKVEASFKELLREPRKRATSEFLQNLKSETCPRIQHWNGFFSEGYTTHPQLTEVRDQLIQSEWNLSASDPRVQALKTNECYERPVNRPLPDGESSCKTVEYYRFHFVPLSAEQNLQVLKEIEAGSGTK